ncbi:MAG: DoxX family protein [Bacteroidota bacterium]
MLLREVTVLLKRPGGLFLLALPVMLEVWLVNPEEFTLYVESLHGWALGFVCFLLGYLCVATGAVFWSAATRHRWAALLLAVGLYGVRLGDFQLQGMPNALIGLESMAWMLAVLGFAARHLDAPSPTLSYFSRAVYPVYIVHMPVQFVAAYVLLDLPTAAPLKLVLLTSATFAGSLLLYEGLRRVRWLGPLFGMKETMSWERRRRWGVWVPGRCVSCAYSPALLFTRSRQATTVPMGIALWIAQGLLAFAFFGAGMMKLTQPKSKLREKTPYVDDFSAGTIRLIGLLEVLGAVGIVLPWLLGVLPVLTGWAALGLALTMVVAAIVHLRRGEGKNVPVNVVLLALALFVVWGRGVPF